jgi:hypothetical protein
VRCDDFDALIEAIADESHQLSADEAAHLAACASCAARLERARAIEAFLAIREVAAPSSAFTANVMARVGAAQWQTERFIDIGFNLAMVAGAFIILAGGIGLAWSLGFLSITIDLEALWEAFNTPAAGRLLSQVQTVAMAAVLLTTALVLWWWAETASD